jgi:MHS family proline/betaine transporter-like MFS transporter
MAKTGDRKSMGRVLCASMVGNGLEWYDFAIYGQLATVLSTLFFPKTDPVVALISTYGVFAAGFIARPVGAVLFGWMGDKYGRRFSLTVAVLMMAIPTGCIGLLPTYQQIGFWAPLLLTVIRILQGLSLGGEFSGSITFMVEHAPSARRGFTGALSLVSLNVGFLLGSAVAAAFSILPEEQFLSWGWRVPFLVGVAIGFVGFYIRTHCDETPVYEVAKAEGHLSTSPIREAVVHHWREMLQAFAIYMTVTMPFYTIAIYFISFTKDHLALTNTDALAINVMTMVVMLFAFAISAALSDRYGRRTVMMGAAAVMLLTAYPAFALFQPGNFWAVAAVEMYLAIVMGSYGGSVPALLVEMFPTSVRYTGMAIPYNLTAALFGGTAPMVCTWLIAKTDTILSIPFYIMICCVFSLLALWHYKDRTQEALQ